MKQLRWTWDRKNSDYIWSEPCYKVKFGIHRLEENHFKCEIPNGLEGVRRLELDHHTSKEAKAYCNKVWTT